MGRKSRQGVLKRQRERKKAEKAEFKRGQRTQRDHSPSGDGSSVASLDDLAAYGLALDPREEVE